MEQYKFLEMIWFESWYSISMRQSIDGAILGRSMLLSDSIRAPQCLYMQEGLFSCLVSPAPTTAASSDVNTFELLNCFVQSAEKRTDDFSLFYCFPFRIAKFSILLKTVKTSRC